jgi:hypothetical protein
MAASTIKIPAISGHCTRDRALEYENVTLFTMDGRSYAVIGSYDSVEWMLLLIVSDQEYEDWANYFCR